MFKALWHFARLWYYTTALEHVGHTHPDALYLTWCCLESQRIVDDFLNQQGA